MAEVTELITKFSFTGSTAPLFDYNEGLGSSIGLLTGFAAASGAAVVAAGKFALNIFEAIDPMVQLSRETGVSIERVQELGFIASVSGSSLESVIVTMESLSQKIGEAATRGSEDFARLGVNIRDFNGNVKSADTILGEVQNRFSSMNLSIQQQRDFAQRLGIDKSMLQLLNRTGGEMDELSKKARALGIVTKEQGDLVADTNDAYTMFGFGLDAIQRQIAIGVGPELKSMAEGFTDLIIANKDWIIEGAQNVIEFTKAIIASFERLSPLLGVIAVGFAGAKVAALGFSGVMAILTAPIVLWTAAIVGALLIIDDLIVAMDGGKSVIADFFSAWFDIDIQPVLKKIVDGVKDMVSTIKNLLTGDFTAAFDSIGQSFTKAMDDFKSFFVLEDQEVNVTKGAIDASGNGVINDVPIFGAEQPVIRNNQANDVGFVPSAGDNTVQQDVTINITANNASEARTGVRQGLQDQLETAQDQFGRGGF